MNSLENVSPSLSTPVCSTKILNSGISVTDFDQYSNKNHYDKQSLKKFSHEQTTSEFFQSQRTNYLQTLMHLLNGFIGSGILSMPITFKNGGLILSSLMNPLIGILSCYCIHMLVQINEIAMKNKHSQQPLDYHELAEFAFKIGLQKLRPWSKIARYYVLTAVIAAQIGGCCVYFLFIATNTEKFLINILGEERSPSKEACLGIILPVVIVINHIRNIRKLTLLSIISNLLQVASIGIIFYNLLSEPWPEFPNNLPAIGEKIPQFFVTSLFIFEGISLSMSLYKTIDEQEKFSRPLGVLNVGLFIIGSFYFALGFMGYGRYGYSVQAAITVNLPERPLYDSVQVMYAIAVLFTYPIILYVPIQVLWPIVEQKFKKLMKQTNEKNGWWMSFKNRILIIELLFRTSLVLFTYILASAIPKLELIISLVGAITSSSIAVIIPSTLHLITFYDKSLNHKRNILLLKNCLIMLIGWLGFFFGTYFSICDIINSYHVGSINQNDDLVINSDSGIINSTEKIRNFSPI